MNSQTQGYDTLADVNARLKSLGFAAIGPKAAGEIQTKVARARFIEALEKAHVSSGAMSFLRKLLKEEGEPTPSAAPAPSLSTHNQQEPSPQRRESVQTNTMRPSAPTEERSQRPGQSNASDDRKYHSIHVYGGKAALCWEADTTRGDDPTVRLEAAAAIGERKYDWKDKVTIQLTRSELPYAAAVFLGLLPETQGKNHGIGDQAGKAFVLQHQGSKVFCKVMAPNKGVRAVPIEPADAFEVGALLVCQIRRSKPWLSGQDVVTMLKAIIARMSQAQRGQ